MIGSPTWAKHPLKANDIFEVTFETAAHRLAVLADFPVHLVKADADFKLVKRYYPHATSTMDWMKIERICPRWGAGQAIEKDYASGTSQITVVHDENGGEIGKFLCISKCCEKFKGRKFAVTVGCALDDAPKFKHYWNDGALPEVHVSTAPCKDCFLREECDCKDKNADG